MSFFASHFKIIDLFLHLIQLKKKDSKIKTSVGFELTTWQWGVHRQRRVASLAPYSSFPKMNSVESTELKKIVRVSLEPTSPYTYSI